MNDLKPFKHGEEGTHYSCDVALKEGLGCCGCNNHDCVENGAEGFLAHTDELYGYDKVGDNGIPYRSVKKIEDISHNYMKGQAHGMQIVAQIIKGMKKYPELVGVKPHMRMVNIDEVYNKALDDILEKLDNSDLIIN